MKAWKNTEERFAAELGVTRLHHSAGNYGEETPDALGGFDYSGPPLIVECKSRKGGFPKLVQRALQQAEKYKEAKNRIPIVGLHRNGGRSNEDWLVVLKLSDFAQILKKGVKDNGKETEESRNSHQG